MPSHQASSSSLGGGIFGQLQRFSASWGGIMGKAIYATTATTPPPAATAIAAAQSMMASSRKPATAVGVNSQLGSGAAGGTKATRREGARVEAATASRPPPLPGPVPVVGALGATATSSSPLNDSGWR